MIRSLRGRLFIGLTAIIILTGAIGGMFAFNWAFDEAIEMQDSILTQIASLAQNSGFSGGQPLPGVEEDAEVWIMELGKAPHDSADDRQLWRYKDGLHVATRAGQPIRVLLRTRADGSRLAVAQPTAVRDETARDMALRTLVPIAALIPCLMLVTALLIAQSLRPMVRLASDLDARRADDMSPLPLKGTPSELHPFIASINGLIARMRLMMDQQRRFIADAAHELRTPIAALSLQAENLDPVDLPAAARHRLAALRQGMDRTKHLLEQLLALARQEAHPFGRGEMPQVSLDQVAKEVVADLLPQALNRNIDLGFELVEPLAVPGEPVMLAAMIRNLLDNALRYTPEGGNVDIGVYPQDGAAILQIEDSGPGIESGDMDRIFEPFFRGAREEVEGTGLGLSIVKRVVDGLGGSIALENITGIGRSGLRVTVKLPL
ncbi:two-component system, OmpR family, sensor kinase [Bradyrhizobium erythrophlei]|jgi:two-component system, OmpR family, sensor kinase|uniref:histidine kinase n=1 Tax=Bradyrhizobium erythrophlei TaxID=1437360 RepID=A0A1M5HSA1_9BRAD|nr:two-component system, OmpR family, sensor kinase [Bradyrhizobium erythrophlei]